MTVDELNKTIWQLEKKFIQDSYELRKQWAKDNAKFEIGDIIGSVVGMLKVEFIGFQSTGKNMEVKYGGRRYTKVKGKFFPTKHDPKHEIIDYGSVNLLLKNPD